MKGCGSPLTEQSVRPWAITSGLPFRVTEEPVFPAAAPNGT